MSLLSEEWLLNVLPPILPMAVAVVIVMAGWFVAAGLIVVFLNMRVKKLEREHTEEAGQKNEGAFLMYALSVLFYPAAFLVGGYFMIKPATVRMGRTCVVLGLVDISAIVVLTCVGMLVLAVLAPDLLP
ncbi:MAG: hypothetical protein JRG91_04495 [Deltaproteobacteria bacterium]|nr:hypothetical protein [Deltaproteobacteria bacterium]